MTTLLTKSTLREALGVTDAGIAEFFGISRAAVAQWDEDALIPQLRRLQAERMRPDLFGEGALSHRDGAAITDEGDAAAQADGVPVQQMSEAA